MTVATYVVEVDWNNDGDYSDAEETITTDVLDFETENGRDYASQLTGRSGPGRASVLLKNTSGKYSSYNASSPIFGNILPGRLVRIRTTAPVAKTIFTGYLKSIVPAATISGIAVARLEAEGPFSRLLGRVTVDPITGNATGTNIDLVLDAAGWSTSLRAVDTGVQTLSFFYLDSQEALKALHDLEEAERGFLYGAADGNVTFENRDYRANTSRSNTSQATFSDAAGATHSYADIQQADMLADIYNFVTVQYTPYTASTQTLDTGYTEGSSLIIGAGGFSDHQFQLADSFRFVGTWFTPVSGSDWIAKSGSTDVTSSTTNVLQSEVSNWVKTYRITNNHGSTVSITKWVQRVQVHTAGDVAEETAEDATSQSKYGLRNYTIANQWLQDATAAQAHADAVIARYKDPKPVLRLVIPANKDTNHMTQALSRLISDRITVVATGTRTKLGISRDFYIESIGHQMTNVGKQHTTTFTLSPV